MTGLKSLVLTLFLVAAAWTPTYAQGKNQLASEGSPYLRQHADDLVHWMAWGEAAFERARKENKPILLSIGYSTCHWCHVMRRESFTDAATAKLINENFIPVLVDRERRPDIDETYALATQLISGVGGWPTNVFLTAERKPFYAAIYMPREVLQRTLGAVVNEWTQHNEELLAGADELAGVIHQYLNRREAAVELTPEKLSEAAKGVMERFDPDYGGVAGGAKFMRPSLLMFLLRQAEAHGTEGALDTVTLTLNGILNGGVHDHVGGGLHRYTEDAAWRVPHFEKMLYDQALVAQIMLRAHALTGDARYEAGARGTLDFVLEHLTDASGGFYSALDAASGEDEGAFYLWTLAELKKVLGEDDAAFMAQMFGVTEAGNFNGSNILFLKNSPENLAGFYRLERDKVEQRIEALLAKLAAARSARSRPGTDTKIITSWNAAMAVAYAEAADRLGSDRYRAVALKNAEFLWTTMRDDTGGFRRSLFGDQLTGDGTLLDNAYAALAFISLYDLTEDETWLERAEATAKFVVETFRDEEAGDFYMTAGDIAFGRTKLRNDGDMPSGSAIMLEVLARLSKRALEPEYLFQAEALLAAVSGMGLRDPLSHAYTLLAGDLLLRGELGQRRYIAKGRVRAKGEVGADGVLRIRLKMQPGWHINSNKPLEEDFIATELSVSGEITYPEPVERSFGFHDQPLSVYEDEVEITATVDKDAQTAELTIQACSDEICLLPETVSLSLTPNLKLED